MITSIQIGKTESFKDLTVYTQAIEDWEAGFWADFKFGNIQCEAGWEAIGNKWLGTVEGN